jgi:cell division protein FtsL
MSQTLSRPIPKVAGFSLQRPRLFPLLIFIALLMGVALFCVWSRLAVVNLEYNISSLEGQVNKMQLQSQRLRLEAASLRSPARIEQIARKELGLRPPTPDQVITVD